VKIKKFCFLAIAVLCLSVMGAATDDDNTLTLRATLKGDNEAPPISTPATADFKATQNADGTFSFTLTFANLRGNLIASHFHFAPKRVSGGVMIFLCGGDSQPACPAATSGTITGTFGAANVVGPTGQGIAAGDLASALEAIGDGLSYVNIHSTLFPGGEARGQVRVRHGDGDRDDRDHD
jgi:hypothetical protein